MKPIVFTKTGYDHLKKEQEVLIALRPQAVEELARARALGDLKENGFYHGAKAKLRAIDSKLERIAQMLSVATVIEVKHTDRVSIGTIVGVFDGKTAQKFTIVGDTEANPSVGNISQNSPIGKALLGKKIGDTVVITIPSGQKTYTITALR